MEIDSRKLISLTRNLLNHQICRGVIKIIFFHVMLACMCGRKFNFVETQEFLATIHCFSYFPRAIVS